MTDSLELWLVRHGETDWNRRGLIQGDSDIPLNGLGIRQAQALAERIGLESFDAVYASDLLRARRTAELSFPDADIMLDARLREINLGDFEGQVWADMPEDERSQIAVWMMGPYDQKVPGGESSDDLRDRVSSWLADLPAAGRVIAFAHGGTIAAILHVFTGRPEPRSWDEPGGWGFRLKNTSISKLSISKTFTSLEVVNDAVHLETLED